MTVRLRVFVVPKSGKDEVAGWRGDELWVKVTAPPEGGKANAAACRVVARALGVPKSGVSVIRGETARHKLVEVEGAAESDVRLAFGEPVEPLFRDAQIGPWGRPGEDDAR